MEKVREPLPEDRIAIPTVDRGGVPSFETFRQDYFEPNAVRAAVRGGDTKRARKQGRSESASLS